MQDRELLELAAKAANMTPEDFIGNQNYMDGLLSHWNPLTDDGDALRLAVNLGLSILPYPVYAENDRHSVVVKQRRRSDLIREQNPTECVELHNGDAMAATRRAIVRAAAEIGKQANP